MVNLKKNSLDLFQYSDPILYLKQVLELRRQKNPLYSLRAWSRELGLSQPTPLSLILLGKRPLPLSYLPKLKKNLSLTALEFQYLQKITGARFSRNPAERAQCMKSALIILKQAKMKVDYIQRLEVFENPLHMILLQLVGLPEFKKDVSWIQKRLFFPIQADEIRSALKLLISTGHLIENKNGSFSKAHKHLYSPQDCSSFFIKKFHETALKQAAEAIYQQGLLDREYGSYVMAIQKSELPEAKKMLRDFTQKFIARFTEGNVQTDALYHLNLNFFSQTKLEEESAS